MQTNDAIANIAIGVTVYAIADSIMNSIMLVIVLFLCPVLRFKVFSFFSAFALPHHITRRGHSWKAVAWKYFAGYKIYGRLGRKGRMVALIEISAMLTVDAKLEAVFHSYSHAYAFPILIAYRYQLS